MDGLPGKRGPLHDSDRRERESHQENDFSFRDSPHQGGALVSDEPIHQLRNPPSWAMGDPSRTLWDHGSTPSHRFVSICLHPRDMLVCGEPGGFRQRYLPDDRPLVVGTFFHDPGHVSHIDISAGPRETDRFKPNGRYHHLVPEPYHRRAVGGLADVGQVGGELFCRFPHGFFLVH